MQSNLLQWPKTPIKVFKTISKFVGHPLINLQDFQVLIKGEGNFTRKMFSFKQTLKEIFECVKHKLGLRVESQFYIMTVSIKPTQKRISANAFAVFLFVFSCLCSHVNLSQIATIWGTRNILITIVLFFLNSTPFLKKDQLFKSS